MPLSYAAVVAGSNAGVDSNAVVGSNAGVDSKPTSLSYAMVVAKNTSTPKYYENNDNDNDYYDYHNICNDRFCEVCSMKRCPYYGMGSGYGPGGT